MQGQGDVEIVGGQVVARFRDYAGLVDAWVQAKDMVGLSNEGAEHIADLTKGQIDKVIGQSRVKGAGVFMFNILTSLLAVEYEMRFDPNALRKMKPRWDGRDASQIRVDARRLSKAAVKQAKTLVFSELARAGAKARNEKLTPAARRRIAQHAARVRWKSDYVKGSDGRPLRRRWKGNRPRADTGPATA